MKNRIGYFVGFSAFVVLLFSCQQSAETTHKRNQLADFVQSGTDSQAEKDRLSDLFLSVISDEEVHVVHEFIFNYVKFGKYPREGSVLQIQISKISAKYNIFT